MRCTVWWNISIRPYNYGIQYNTESGRAQVKLANTIDITHQFSIFFPSALIVRKLHEFAENSVLFSLKLTLR
jgi:hypothetical protein